MNEKSFSWLLMAEGSLAGASQMVWQNPTVVDENRRLYGRVLNSQSLTEQDWRNRITWAGAVLLALSRNNL